MSADNYIAVQKIGRSWHVWHESASNEMPFVPLDRSEEFRMKSKAIRYAAEMEEDIGIVEYGISILDPVSSWKEYYVMVDKYWSDEYWKLVENFQERKRQDDIWTA